MFFKDGKNNVFHLPSHRIDLKKDDWVEINEDEAKTISTREYPLDLAKQYAKARIDIARQNELFKPIEIDGVSYLYSNFDIPLFTQLFTKKSEIDIILADGSASKLNESTFNQILDVVKAKELETLEKAYDLKLKIEKAQNNDEIKEIKWQ